MKKGLLFADSSVVIAQKLGNTLTYLMGNVVEKELMQKLPEKGIAMPSNLELAPASDIRSTQGVQDIYDKLKVGGRHTSDWEAWLEVPPSRIFVSLDHDFAKKAASNTEQMEKLFGPMAPIAVVLPDRYEMKKLHWGAKGKVFSFFSMEQFEASLTTADYDIEKWMALGRQAGGDFPDV